ncbi:mCG1032915 [Mus musculus]|nr:mCG1032915 [Mus musculus]
MPISSLEKKKKSMSLAGFLAQDFVPACYRSPACSSHMLPAHCTAPSRPWEAAESPALGSRSGG